MFWLVYECAIGGRAFFSLFQTDSSQSTKLLSEPTGSFKFLMLFQISHRSGWWSWRSPRLTKDPACSYKATLSTVLEAIRGIQRSNQTTMEAMEKSFEEKLEDLRWDLSEKQEKACDKLSKDEGKREVPIQKERK